MSTDLSRLLEEANGNYNTEQMLQKIGESAAALLAEKGLVLPAGIEIMLNDSRDDVAVSFGENEPNSLIEIIIRQCAVEELQKLSGQAHVAEKQGGDLDKLGNKVLAFIFYVFNIAAFLGSTTWIFSILSSSDFRQWYYSEYFEAGTAFVSLTFALLLPAVLLASTLVFFLLGKNDKGSKRITKVLFTFELPVLIMVSMMYLFVSEADLTNGLQVLITSLLGLLVFDWFLTLFKQEGKTMFGRVAQYALSLNSLSIVTYLCLAGLVPFTYLLLTEIPWDEIGEIIGMLVYSPFSFLYMLFGLLLALCPYIIAYVAFKVLLGRLKSLGESFEGSNINNISKALRFAVPVGLVLLLFIASTTKDIGKYGEDLILLAQTDDSYTTQSIRADSLIDKKEEVDELMRQQMTMRSQYLFDSSDFDGESFGWYYKTVLFPFVDRNEYRVDSFSSNRAAYQEGYLKAFGEQYSVRGNDMLELKQVQHLTRDVLVDTQNSDYLATVVVTDSFSTFVTRDQEVVMEFSLPENAVVTDLKLGSALQHQGQIAPRGAAEQVYTEQVRARIDPALLEQVGPRQYRLRVYPVPASNQIAERARREEVEGEVQRVQFTYLVLRDEEGVPLPVYSQNYNILDSETEFDVSLDGKSAKMTKDRSHVSDPVSINSLCSGTSSTTIMETPYQYSRIMIGEGVNNRVCGEEYDVASVSGKRIRFLVDTSYQNEDAEMEEQIKQITSLPEEFFQRNTVDMVLFSNSKSDPIKLNSSKDVPDYDQIVFFGKSDIRQVLANITSDTDMVVVLAGELANYDNSNTNITYPELGSLNVHKIQIAFVHTPGRIPAYNSSIEKVLKGRPVTVHTDVAGALREGITRVEHKDTLYGFGRYWYVEGAVLRVDQLSDFTSSTLDTGEKIMIAKILNKYDLVNKDTASLSQMDSLHQRAVREGIVTPLSSYIALVNQTQQNRLDNLSGDGDRYTSENRFQVTQPRVNTNFLDAGAGFGGSSLGLNDARDSGMVVPSVGVGGGGGGGLASGGNEFVESKTSPTTTPQIMFIILIISALAASGYIMYRKRKG